MKRILVTISAIALLLVATFALAQQPRRVMIHGGPGMGPGAEGCDGTQFLGLSAEQKTQWDTIHQQLADTVKPLFDQKVAAEQKLHSLVDAANPDATAIGNQVLAIKAIDQQLKAAHEGITTKLSAILNADQKVKFDAMQAVHACGAEHGPSRMMIHRFE